VRPVQDIGNVPRYWIRPERALPASAGMHRVTWDLRHPPVPEKTPGFPIAAIPQNTAPNATSPLAMPGNYTVRLTADGRTVTQPLVLQIDPRVTTPAEGLASQFNESMKVYSWLRDVEAARATKDSESLEQLSDALRALLERLQSADTAPATQLISAVREIGTTVTEALKK
jgi:hypothetical protein